MVELQTSMFNISSHLLSFNSLFFWLFQAERSKCKGMWPLPCRIKLAHSLSPLPLCLSQPPRVALACCMRHLTMPSSSLYTPPPHGPPCPPLVTTHTMLPCTSQSHTPLCCACCSCLHPLPCCAHLSHPCCPPCHPCLSHPRNPPCCNHNHNCSNNTPNM